MENILICYTLIINIHVSFMNLMISQVNNIKNEKENNREYKHTVTLALVRSRRRDFEMKVHG